MRKNTHTHTHTHTHTVLTLTHVHSHSSWETRIDFLPHLFFPSLFLSHRKKYRVTLKHSEGNVNNNTFKKKKKKKSHHSVKPCSCLRSCHVLRCPSLSVCVEEPRKRCNAPFWSKTTGHNMGTCAERWRRKPRRAAYLQTGMQRCRLWLQEPAPLSVYSAAAHG